MPGIPGGRRGSGRRRGGPGAVLSGTAAAVFLLVGYILRQTGRASSLSATLLAAGWGFGAVTAGALLVAAVALLFTALRNGPTLATGPYGVRGQEVDRAREAWRVALLEGRGGWGRGRWPVGARWGTGVGGRGGSGLYTGTACLPGRGGARWAMRPRR